MAINLNQDMGAIMRDLLGKNKGGSSAKGNNGATAIAPFINAIVLFLLTLAVCGAYVQFYYLPTKAANLKKSEEIKRLTDLQKKSEELKNKIVTIKKTLNESKEHYLESLSHFGNSEDLGALYQSISTLAAKYDLTVLNIKEIPVVAAPASKAAKTAAKDDKKDKKDKKGKDADAAPPVPKTEVKEIKVEAEIKGAYGQYIQFKEDLAVAEMLLKVNEETITVKPLEAGTIYATLNLSTYAIDKKPFQNLGTPTDKATAEKPATDNDATDKGVTK